jgi:hypothetical protein
VWWPIEVAIENATTRDALIELSAASATLAACVLMAQRASVRLAACAGAAFVTRWYETEMLINGSDRSRLLFGPSASIDGRYALSGSLFAVASAGLTVMLPEDRFLYIDRSGREQPAYEPSVIGVSMALGIGARL